ncbi:MAG: UvrD-helicase domain-containing protein, partial [Planctomycetes bacterium]|nr:UvrD-helicase domain-containing protein [Planctomycetota bacterium]
MTTTPQTTLTTEQHAALSAHDRSVSLAAGAGCGKTFVLTERYLSYLDPCKLQPMAELSELVAITFTDAAAREMRDRIRRRCYQRMQAAEDSSERSAWKQLLSTLDGARISTIHAFCATLLRSHAAEAAVDPRFELLDPPTAQLMRLQSLDDHLRQLLVAGDERLIQLATHFGLRNLRDYVAALLSDEVGGMVARWGNTSPVELAKHWQQHYDEFVAPAALVAIVAAEPVERLRELCSGADVSKAKAQTHFGELLALFDSLPESKTPHVSALKLRGMAKVQGVCTKKDWADEADYNAMRDACKAVRDLIDKSLLRYPLASEKLEAAAAIGLDLLQLVAEVSARYTDAKQQRNVLEFDDLLSRTEALLTDKRYPQVQQNLVRSTQLLMVDEFQDTDPLQVAIVKALRGDNWAEQGLFVVGDFKQSIYRFRGAEPRVSSELRATLPAESRLSLTTNFRSQPAVLDFVNALFHDAFAEGYEPLSAHRPQLSPTPAIEFLWAQPDANPQQSDNSKSRENKGDRRLGDAARARMQEARFIARRLAQLLDEGEPLVVDTSHSSEPTARPLQLGDIAILLRSLSDVALYEEAFREYGLDYYLAGGHAFYAQQEIYDVLHLLRAIASPVDDLSLAGVLRSPMFALADETLFWLAEQGGTLNGGLFGDALPDELSPAERAKTLRAATTLGELRQQKDRRLVAQLLSQAIAATGYDATLLTEFLGQRKWANVQKLIEQARTLDRTRPGDLNGFVTQLSEFVLRAPKEPLAATRSEGDVIRIMTIHYAKGLEFPLVVVPDLDRPNFPGSRQPVFDEQLGPLVPSPEKQDLVGWDLHRFAEQEQEREERKRLLYVACTRAADYLLLSSSSADLQKPKSDWLKLLGEHFDLAQGTCLTKLPEGYATPEIRVTTDEPSTARKPVGPTRGADLQKLIAKTHQLAESGLGVVPPEVAPIAVNTQARKRFSFSRLSGTLEIASREPRVASKDKSNDVEARALGTLVHAVLERINFAQPPTDLADLCEFLAPQHTESTTQTTTNEATRLVEIFLQSPRAATLSTAPQIHREVEFLLPWPLDKKSHQGRYLQGYIDCLYQDTSGDWHILDYKSNQVTAAEVPQAAEHYAMQMFVYSLACERALGVAPVESVLHFLRSSTEFEFQWTDAERLAMTNQIDHAMQSQMKPQ